MRRDKNSIAQMTTKRIRDELVRVDGEFWAWQAGGPKPGYAIEKYAEGLDDELKNRGQSE